jgi:hypothetical protein
MSFDPKTGGPAVVAGKAGLRRFVRDRKEVLDGHAQWAEAKEVTDAPPPQPGT